MGSSPIVSTTSRRFLPRQVTISRMKRWSAPRGLDGGAENLGVILRCINPDITTTCSFHPRSGQALVQLAPARGSQPAMATCNGRSVEHPSFLGFPA